MDGLVRPAVQSQWWSPLVLHVMIASPKVLHPQARFGCTVQCGLEKCMRMWSWVRDPVSHGHSWAWAVLSWLGWLKLSQLGWIALLLKKNYVQWIDLSVCFICISVVFIAETSPRYCWPTVNNNNNNHDNWNKGSNNSNNYGDLERHNCSQPTNCAANCLQHAHMPMV